MNTHEDTTTASSYPGPKRVRPSHGRGSSASHLAASELAVDQDVAADDMLRASPAMAPLGLPQLAAAHRARTRRAAEARFAALHSTRFFAQSTTGTSSLGTQSWRWTENPRYGQRASLARVDLMLPVPEHADTPEAELDESPSHSRSPFQQALATIRIAGRGPLLCIRQLVLSTCERALLPHIPAVERATALCWVWQEACQTPGLWSWRAMLNICGVTSREAQALVMAQVQQAVTAASEQGEKLVPVDMLQLAATLRVCIRLPDAPALDASARLAHPGIPQASLHMAAAACRGDTHASAEEWCTEAVRQALLEQHVLLQLISSRATPWHTLQLLCGSLGHHSLAQWHSACRKIQCHLGQGAGYWHSVADLWGNAGLTAQAQAHVAATLAEDWGEAAAILASSRWVAGLVTSLHGACCAGPATGHAVGCIWIASCVLPHAAVRHGSAELQHAVAMAGDAELRALLRAWVQCADPSEPVLAWLARQRQPDQPLAAVGRSSASPPGTPDLTTAFPAIQPVAITASAPDKLPAHTGSSAAPALPQPAAAAALVYSRELGRLISPAVGSEAHGMDALYAKAKHHIVSATASHTARTRVAPALITDEVRGRIAAARLPRALVDAGFLCTAPVLSADAGQLSAAWYALPAAGLHPRWLLGHAGQAPWAAAAARGSEHAVVLPHLLSAGLACIQLAFWMPGISGSEMQRVRTLLDDCKRCCPELAAPAASLQVAALCHNAGLAWYPSGSSSYAALEAAVKTQLAADAEPTAAMQLALDACHSLLAAGLLAAHAASDGPALEPLLPALKRAWKLAAHTDSTAIKLSATASCICATQLCCSSAEHARDALAHALASFSAQKWPFKSWPRGTRARSHALIAWDPVHQTQKRAMSSYVLHAARAWTHARLSHPLNGLMPGNVLSAVTGQRAAAAQPAAASLLSPVHPVAHAAYCAMADAMLASGTGNPAPLHGALQDAAHSMCVALAGVQVLSSLHAALGGVLSDRTDATPQHVDEHALCHWRAALHGARARSALLDAAQLQCPADPANELHAALVCGTCRFMRQFEACGARGTGWVLTAATPGLWQIPAPGDQHSALAAAHACLVTAEWLALACATLLCRGVQAYAVPPKLAQHWLRWAASMTPQVPELAALVPWWSTRAGDLVHQHALLHARAHQGAGAVGWLLGLAQHAHTQLRAGAASPHAVLHFLQAYALPSAAHLPRVSELACRAACAAGQHSWAYDRCLIDAAAEPWNRAYLDLLHAMCVCVPEHSTWPINTVVELLEAVRSVLQSHQGAGSAPAAAASEPEPG